MSLAQRSDYPQTLKLVLSRYARADQPALRAFALAHPRHADLAETFPAAALRIALDADLPEIRPASELVRQGASLRRIGESCGLPFWMRRISPELLHHRLAPDLLHPSDDAEFGRALLNMLPDCPEPGSRWLARVLEARRLCHERFAIWLGGEMRGRHELGDGVILPILAGFAWGVDALPGRPGWQPWTPDLSFSSACRNARDYLLLSINGAHVSADPGLPWPSTLVLGGYELRKIETVEDLNEAARLLRNCLAGYADEIEDNSIHIYTIWRKGRLRAAAEFDADLAPTERVRLAQAAGPQNRQIGVRIAALLYKAVEEFSATFAASGCRTDGASVLWADLWRRYRADKGDDTGRLMQAEITRDQIRVLLNLLEIRARRSSAARRTRRRDRT